MKAETQSDLMPPSWLDGWLSHPLPALGGHLPSDYLETDDGCDLLVQLIRRAQTGAFS